MSNAPTVIIVALGWIGTLGVLGTYAFKRRRFDLANALLWPLVIAPSVAAHVWSAAAITLAFGVIGTVNTVRRT